MTKSNSNIKSDYLADLSCDSCDVTNKRQKGLKFKSHKWKDYSFHWRAIAFLGTLL